MGRNNGKHREVHGFGKDTRRHHLRLRQPYEVSGKQVLIHWFSYRKKEMSPDGVLRTQ